MKMNVMAGSLLVMGLMISLGFAASKARTAGAQVLAAGAYSAQVKGIVCGGCGSVIQETMEKINGIENVSVDQDKKTVQFQVKKDVKLKLAVVQKALQASADKMGMGADYQLRNLKKTS